MARKKGKVIHIILPFLLLLLLLCIITFVQKEKNRTCAPFPYFLSDSAFRRRGGARRVECVPFVESSLDSDAGSTTTYCSTDAIVCVCVCQGTLKKSLCSLIVFLVKLVFGIGSPHIESLNTEPQVRIVSPNFLKTMYQIVQTSCKLT